MRGVFRRRLEQPGQHGGLGQCHIPRRFAEIELRRRLHAKGTPAHIRPVEIELEYFLLCQSRFEPERQKRFLDLALQRTLIGEEQILGELLGDGGAALHDAIALRIGHDGAQSANGVDAEMVVEAPVLGGERGLDQMLGQIIERGRAVMKDAAAADGGAVAVEERNRKLLPFQPVVILHGAEGWNRERKHKDGGNAAEGQPLAQPSVNHFRQPRTEKNSMTSEKPRQASATVRFDSNRLKRRREKRASMPLAILDRRVVLRNSAMVLGAAEWPIVAAKRQRLQERSPISMPKLAALADVVNAGAAMGEGCVAAFWEEKALEEMSETEWESLCDGCGRCCLVKLEDEDTGRIHFTDIGCTLLDAAGCRCRDYAQRQARVPDCVKLTPETVRSLKWLPKSCAYRLIRDGEPLQWWHPLVSGNSETVHQAGVSVRGRVSGPEEDFTVPDMIKRIVRWPGMRPKAARTGSR